MNIINLLSGNNENMLLEFMYTLCTHTLVWSDFHFFRFLKMGTLLSIVYIIFMSSFLKNRRISFSFSKITDTLKIYFFFKLSEPFLLQKRTIVKSRIQNLNLFSILFYFSKMAKTVFDLKIVYLHFLLLNKKGNFFVSGETFKNVNKNFFFQVSLCFLLFNKKGNSFVSVETFKHVKSNFFLHSTLI